jgi:hypothetical protein
MEAEGLPEILVCCYQTTRRQKLEGINLAKVINVRHLESPSIVANGQCSFRSQSHSAGWSWCAVFLRFVFRFGIVVEAGVTMSWSWPSQASERACIVTGATVFVRGTSLQLEFMCRVLESFRQYCTVYTRTWLVSRRLYSTWCPIFRSIRYNGSLKRSCDSSLPSLSDVKFCCYFYSYDFV